jgi:Hypothetical protein (DUF2513)
MKREMDFVRELLLSIEDGNSEISIVSQEMAANQGFKYGRGLENDYAQKLSGHLKILEQAKLIEVKPVPPFGYIKIVELMWDGHDFLDSIRDPDTWEKTKQGALAAGGWTVDVLRDLAKGLIKKKIEDTTGVKL